jgi:hypothetical protein
VEVFTSHKERLLRTIIVGAVLSVGMAVAPALASAQSVTPDTATMICRQARPAEQASAQTIGSQPTPLVCRQIHVVVEPQLHVIGSATVNAGSPNSNKPPWQSGLTGKALDQAMAQWFLQSLTVYPGGD